MIFGVVDVGSNSIKLLVARRSGSGARPSHWHWIEQRVAITGLARGLATTGRLAAAGRERTVAVLREFLAVAEQHGCREIAAVGTQCLRVATDATEFLRQIRLRAGLDVDVIAGDEEARLGYRGATADQPAGMHLITCDVGGASTEITRGTAGVPVQRTSLDVGVLVPTARWLSKDPPSLAGTAAATRELTQCLAPLGTWPRADRLIGIGGTPASLAAVALNRPFAETLAVHGEPLSRVEIARQIRLFGRSSLAARRRLPGLHPDRADVILAGSLVVAGVMDRLGCHELTVSVHGLRLGLLMDQFASA